MKFDVIGFENKQLWEKITQDREVYYQWQYVDAFYRIGDGIPKLAYAKKDNDYVYNVFFLRNINEDLKLNNYEKECFDIITPYGYGGIDCINNNKELLNFYLLEFEKYCNNNNIISEFIRLSPFLDNYKNYNEDYNITNISKTVHMKLENPEQIWNDMESRCRNTIRKAQKNNLIIKSGINEKMMEEFIQIYRDTMSRDEANSYYFFSNEFFNSLYNNLQHLGEICTVYLESKPISSSVIMYNKTSAHYHLSGTLSEYMKYGANNFGLYQIALNLCEKGCKTFHLGGGYGGDNSPLLKFKKSFNKKEGELNFYIGKRIYNKRTYEELCDIEKISDLENYFPAYRANED